MAKPPGKCIFCGFEGDLTGEHLLSQRFRKHIPQTARSYRMLRSVEFHDRSAYQAGKRNADPRDWKVKSVCERTCNNGWMRRLEDEAEPLLVSLFTGKPFRMTQDQQSLIATWAVMKAIVIDFIDPEEATTHHMQRRAVYRHKRPPKQGWAVWIGSHPTREWSLYYRSCPLLSLRDEVLAKRSTDRATYYNSATISYVVGELFVQVLHFPKPIEIDRWTFPIFPDGGSLRRIWPVGSYSLAWPPQPMSGQDIEIAFHLYRNIAARAALRARYPETFEARFGGGS